MAGGWSPEEGPPGGPHSVRRVSPEPSLRLEPSRCRRASWRRGQRVIPWRRHARFSVVGQMRRLAAASRRPTPNCACGAHTDTEFTAHVLQRASCKGSVSSKQPSLMNLH